MSSRDAFLAARDFLLAHRDDYDAAYAGFAWPRLDRFNWALDYFDLMAAGNDRLGLRLMNENGLEHRLTFAALASRSNQVANFLRRRGVARGDRVLIVLGNEPAIWETMLAAMKLGAVVIPATSLLTTDDLRDRVGRGRARHVIAGVSSAPGFDAVPGNYTRIVVGGPHPGWTDYGEAAAERDTFTPDAPTRASDPLLLYFTSGTTSKPKLVLHSHESYPVGHLSTMYWIGLRPDDVHWNISSPGWAKHAWSSVFAPWNAGATVFALSYTRFEARVVLDALVRCDVTSICAPPTVWRMLVQAPLADYPVKLRELVSAGEPLNPEIIAHVQESWGLTIRDGFGQTETTAQVGNSPGARVKPGSMGRPLPGFRIALLDPGGQPGAEGEIAIDLSSRPAGLMLGYEDDAEKTAEVMRDGHYRTGDVAMRDADGYITCVGRADDVFKASDYRISPFELESALIEHPAVAEAAVVPSPDPLRLAVPKAFIVLASGYEPTAALAREIFAFLRPKLAPYKRVRRIEFAELPKTISGKIRRVQLRAAEAERRTVAERRPLEFFEEDR